MTHEPERTFEDHVEHELLGRFGAANVRRQPQLIATDRRPDFAVEGAFCEFLIELENDFESIWTGIGQATLYAAHRENTVPVVAVPEGHIEEPEAMLIRARTPVVLWEVEYEPDADEAEE